MGLSIMWAAMGVGYMFLGVAMALSHPPVDPTWYCAGLLAFILAELKAERR